ncbi:MAG: ATP-binding protein [Zoogloeaceae bacterium]|jgi:hypothetical protein|nr:ATP-binding protein [Zoogloeaceae bacterium]
MNPIDNPYAPGAGTPPPELAGRDGLREQVRIAAERVRVGRPAKSLLLVGLRGVGKTVLLDRMRDESEARGFHTLRMEAPENRSLPALLAPQLRLLLLRLSRMRQVRALCERALRGLAGFVKAMKLIYRDIEVNLDFDPEPGLADNGDLEHDLPELLALVGEAAKGAETGILLFIDELQYVEETQLAALITALHRAAQRQMPVMMVGAGLANLPGRMGRAKTYAERLFDITRIGPLSDADARDAIEKPANGLGVSFAADALDRIIAETRGYPYFLQEWGKRAWDVAAQSPVTLRDVEQASLEVVAALDEGFFRVRFDRLKPTEKKYLRAMAELGPGAHRSGEIAALLGRKVTALGFLRNELIAKGMIWSPAYGDTEFTVPMFDAFMKRVMPGDDWR